MVRLLTSAALWGDSRVPAHRGHSRGPEAAAGGLGRGAGMAGEAAFPEHLPMAVTTVAVHPPPVVPFTHLASSSGSLGIPE